MQRTYASFATASSTVSTIPHDDSIPQSTEGAEIFTLSITPTNAANILRVLVVGNLAHDGGGVSDVAVALFRDSTADAKHALSLAINGTAAGFFITHFPLFFEEVAGGVSATTYKIRIGRASGTLYYNQGNGGRRMGGVMNWTMIIEELTP